MEKFRAPPYLGLRVLHLAIKQGKKGWRKSISFFKKKIKKKDFIYLVLERGKGREKKRERNINVWLLLMHPPLGT